MTLDLSNMCVFCRFSRSSLNQDLEGAYCKTDPGKGSDRRIDDKHRDERDIEDKPSSEQLFEKRDRSGKVINNESHAHLVYIR